MSVWVSIAHAPKDRAVDLWGYDCTEAQSRALMMPHPEPRRFADGFWGSPQYTRPSGLVMNHDESWYRRDGDKHHRIWPTHYMEIPEPPND